MGIFLKLFSLFSRRRPSRDLQEHYASLKKVGENLPETLTRLRKRQKAIVKRRISAKTGRATGKLSLSKTLFIEEEFVPKLKRLVQISKDRLNHATEAVKKEEPLTGEELLEIERIKAFLEKVQGELPELEKLNEMPEEDQAIKIETVLRNVTELSKRFHETEKYEIDLIRRVVKHEISPLMKNLFENPEKLPTGEYTYTLTKEQLRELEKEAENINACQDNDYKITWRRWWRGKQKTEADVATPIIKPHIDVTIKLFGKPKKDIHLLLAA